MSDPYKILGITSDASDDEVKRAYRELAKKYHPDNHGDNPLSDLAADKMKEINEAYDEIQKLRKNSGEKAYNGAYSRIRELIQQGRFSEAEILLQRNPEKSTSAEWNYLYGLVCRHKGWLFDARQYLENACRLDPTNQEYRLALSYLNQTADTSRHTGHTSGCSGCDICLGLMCLDCLCRFCR